MANLRRSIARHRWTSSAERLSAASGDNYVLGAFADGKLVGTVGFARNTRLKERHKARIWGVFVQEEHRGQGIARRLMAEVLQRAESLAGLEQIILTVGDHRLPRNVYMLRLGSLFSGTSAAHSKWAIVYVDEDYMVFVSRRANRRTALKRFRKILPVSEILAW